MRLANTIPGGRVVLQLIPTPAKRIRLAGEWTPFVLPSPQTGKDGAALLGPLRVKETLNEFTRFIRAPAVGPFGGTVGGAHGGIYQRELTYPSMSVTHPDFSTLSRTRGIFDKNRCQAAMTTC